MSDLLDQSHLEPVTYLKRCRIIDNGGKEYDSLRFSSASDQRGFAVVRLSEAADAITRLQKGLEAARSALKPFAEAHVMGDNYVQFHPSFIVKAREVYRALKDKEAASK